MAFERFSKAEFDARGRGSDEAQQLAAELQSEAELELNKVFESTTRRIVDRLNELGHNLKLEPDDPNAFSGVLTYGDYAESADKPGYDLQFAVDLIVSSGYPFKARYPPE